jgi:hypothetical protein
MWRKAVLVVLLLYLLKPENVHHRGVVTVVYKAILELNVLIVVELSSMNFI